MRNLKPELRRVAGYVICDEIGQTGTQNCHRTANTGKLKMRFRIEPAILLSGRVPVSEI